MTPKKYLTDFNEQCARLLAWLQTATITTLQELDIFHPVARIKEPRDLTYKIDIHWTTVDTGKGKHRTACYVLLARV